MNRKWFGEALALLAIIALVASCTKKIPGDPDKTLERYIKALQAQDMQTITDLNHLSARQLKFLRQSSSEDRQKSIDMALEGYKEAFDAAPHTFQQGITWSERYFFPAGAKFTIGEPYSPVKVGDDPVNAEYEKSNNSFVPVDVVYPDSKTAPDHGGKKVKSAHYDCSMKKIREGRNVAIYSHDDTWYFGGCVVNQAQFTYFE